MNNRLNDLRQEYEKTEIPAELDTVIRGAMERANQHLKEYKGGEPQMNKRSGKWFLKGLAGAAAVVILFTAAVNTLPGFAAAASHWPVVGKLVKILQFNDGQAGGGAITDGSKMQPVVLKKEKEHEQIAFSFAQGDGGEGEAVQPVAPNYQISYKEKPYTLTFTVNGVRYLDEQSFDELKNSDLVADAYQLITLDDSSYRFVLEFRKPVKYEVQEYTDPGHIVLTLSEDKEAEEKTLYSVRTETYTNGEKLGIVEEGLYEENGIRMLKENGDQFYIELASFADEAEANHLAAIMNDKYGPKFQKDYGMAFKVFVERR
ncbi:DUF4179 domain-containing protein [Paenibacillus thiaminolyticus]|uniref:DUF4179 domain-containing protein n=1 Tax=Paenibacillus thiaminolyticus TaxID=49283 RepID=UPI002330C71D|nr:DUF4179 domain-containing protein [Paenibacillus thiaminolyticus]WCF08357.1 DUF4179 domain-containing protein [Paenibacillus thiaminolyticus]